MLAPAKSVIEQLVVSRQILKMWTLTPVIVLLLALGTPHTSRADLFEDPRKAQEEKVHPSEQCFCKLEGKEQYFKKAATVKAQLDPFILQKSM